MQYKIPVQIENEDPIVLGLSLRQLSILIGGGGLAYVIYGGLVKIVGPDVALLPAGIIFVLTLLVVFLKISEMTFLPYILNLIRQSINGGPKKWVKGVDSFQPIDIGYVVKTEKKKEITVEIISKKERMESLKDKLKNI